MRIEDVKTTPLTVGDKTFNILSNVPEEYTALVDAISSLFYVLGSKKLCGACFQGKLLYDSYAQWLRNDKSARESELAQDVAKGSHLSHWPSNGCCGRCPNLSTEGCVQKPLGCAMWTCYYTRTLLPKEVLDFLGDPRSSHKASLKFWLAKRLGYDIFSFFRIQGLSVPLDTQKRRVLRIAANRVQKVAVWLERTHKTNWPLMEKITYAAPGTFTDGDKAGAAQGSNRRKRPVSRVAATGLRSSADQCGV